MIYIYSYSYIIYIYIYAHVYTYIHTFTWLELYDTYIYICKYVCMYVCIGRGRVAGAGAQGHAQVCAFHSPGTQLKASGRSLRPQDAAYGLRTQLKASGRVH